MTFEEFLTKKKIDLEQFLKAEPNLFAEFHNHYSQMGPKSFDHSKKFLFNKLRRAYHLKEVPKPLPVKEVIQVNEIASQAEPLLSPTVEATVYTPRVRAGGAKKAEPESANPADESVEPADGKYTSPSFIPRFKAQPVNKIADPVAETKEETTELPKPGFKPRFKPGMSGTSHTKTIDKTEEEIPGEKPKQAYVPRFKAAAFVAPNQADEVKPVDETNISGESNEGTPLKSKPAYVPRFKAPAPTKPNAEPNSDDTISDS